MSLIFDQQPPLTTRTPTDVVTVMIAARNKENRIAGTVTSLADVDYPAGMRLILADNGSTDDTAGMATRAAVEAGIDLRVIREERPGKSNALNTALLVVDTALVVTIDADTVLHRDAMRNLVARLDSAPPDTVAVAGSVLARNSRVNLLTRMQEWEYYLGIAAVKRMQGMYQSTLVAQVAFSLYRMMEGGQGVVFEPAAVAFTDVPDRLVHFIRQRSRWARGMLEGLHAVPAWRQRRGLTNLVASVDLLIPLLDGGYAFIWLPGVVLFLLGYQVLCSSASLVG